MHTHKAYLLDEFRNADLSNHLSAQAKLTSDLWLLC
jgi:hypothetical protein